MDTRLYTTILSSKVLIPQEDQMSLLTRSGLRQTSLGLLLLFTSPFSLVFVCLFISLHVLAACDSIFPIFISVKISNFIQYKIEMCH